MRGGGLSSLGPLGRRPSYSTFGLSPQPLLADCPSAPALGVASALYMLQERLTALPALHPLPRYWFLGIKLDEALKTLTDIRPCGPKVWGGGGEGQCKGRFHSRRG